MCLFYCYSQFSACYTCKLKKTNITLNVQINALKNVLTTSAHITEHVKVHLHKLTAKIEDRVEGFDTAARRYSSGQLKILLRILKQALGTEALKRRKIGNFMRIVTVSR